MGRVFVTGSADGLGLLAAQTLLDEGHEVVVHARNSNRLEAVRDLVGRGALFVVGDLADIEQTRGIAHDVNALGRMDAVIHNAGVYTGPQVMPINTVAPYLLTALIDRPQRLVYLGSGAHYNGQPSLADVDWSGRRVGSYSDSELFVTTLAAAVAPALAGCLQQRRRPRRFLHPTRPSDACQPSAETCAPRALSCIVD
jgi:NAD(P)-dependent dehydrogenase (short-subunit alcohol dehydrogenase family)